MDTNGKVIVVKGSPGVGKTYVCKKLVQGLKKKSNKVARIEVDEVAHIDQRNYSKKKELLAIVNTASIVNNFYNEQFFVVVDYTFNISTNLKKLLENIKLSSRYEDSIFVFHLSASFREVQKRNKKRIDGSNPLSLDILEELYDACQATAGEVQGEVVVETDKVSVKNIVNQVMKKVISS